MQSPPRQLRKFGFRAKPFSPSKKSWLLFAKKVWELPAAYVSETQE
jgi:hypothetical protein